MPRLLIDGTPISANAKGVGRYAYHLCLQLAQRLPNDWTLQVLTYAGGESLFPPYFRAAIIPVRRASEFWNAFFLIPRQTRQLKSQVLLKTYEGAGFVSGVPTVTICHDIDSLITTAQGNRRNPLRTALDVYKQRLRLRALQNSDFVVCNSQFTRQAVEEHYRISSGRTRVAYCAVDPRFYQVSTNTSKETIRKRYGVENFILAFATGDPRENFHCYPQIAAKIVALGVATCFLIAGMQRNERYAQRLRTEFARLGLIEGEHFIFEDFFGADRFQELAELYTAADFYLDLSLHEGFGMQLVEALACGTACISSSSGALAEIGGEYALFVDPKNPDQIGNAIRTAYDNNLHQKNRREQVLYTHKFSWDSAGKVVTDVLLQVANSRL